MADQTCCIARANMSSKKTKKIYNMSWVGLEQQKRTFQELVHKYYVAYLSHQLLDVSLDLNRAYVTFPLIQKSLTTLPKLPPRDNFEQARALKKQVDTLWEEVMAYEKKLRLDHHVHPELIHVTRSLCLNPCQAVVDIAEGQLTDMTNELI